MFLTIILNYFSFLTQKFHHKVAFKPIFPIIFDCFGVKNRLFKLFTLYFRYLFYYRSITPWSARILSYMQHKYHLNKAKILCFLYFFSKILLFKQFFLDFEVVLYVFTL